MVQYQQDALRTEKSIRKPLDRHRYSIGVVLEHAHLVLLEYTKSSNGPYGVLDL